jgi:hypothetical protein
MEGLVNVFKTIVLTATIASATTGVAVAGVQAVAQPQASGATPVATQASKAQVGYTVTLTASQLRRLAGMIGGPAARRNGATARHDHAGTTPGHHVQAEVHTAAHHVPGQATSAHHSTDASHSGTSGGAQPGYQCPSHNDGGSSGHGCCDGGGHGGCD